MCNLTKAILHGCAYMVLVAAGFERLHLVVDYRIVWHIAAYPLQSYQSFFVKEIDRIAASQ
jgi:hypothetical protein